jgi:FtsH-binding integral membrane protein
MEKKKDIWFSAKTYGIGWGLPVSWQGWAVLIVYLVVVIVAAVRVSDSKDLVWFFPLILLMSLLLILICWRKGASFRWRWGNKKQ